MDARPLPGAPVGQGPGAAQAWFDGVITKSGAKTTTETYNGTTLTISTEPNKPKAAFAVIDGKVAAIGDVASVKAAVDTKGNSGFAVRARSEGRPRRGRRRPRRLRLCRPAAAARLVDRPEQGRLARCRQGRRRRPRAARSLKAVPAWTAYWLRFESDAIVMEAAAPKPETPIGPTQNRTSTVVEHVPASAVVVSVSHDFGATLKQMLALYRSDPALKETARPSSTRRLDLVGGSDAALGWIGDTAIVVNVAGGDARGRAGHRRRPTRPAASQLFTALKAFIALGGATQGITVREESYDGTTITIVDLGDLGKLAGMADLTVGGRAAARPATSRSPTP